MPRLMPEELVRAELLMYEGKEEQALEVIANFEKNKGLKSEQQLFSLILKGRSSAYLRNNKDSEGIGELAYELSQKQGRSYESVEALILKAGEKIWRAGEFDEAKILIKKAESLFNSLTDVSSSDISKLKANLLEVEVPIHLFKNYYRKASKLANECLSLWEEIGNKSGVITILLLLGHIKMMLSDYDTAIDYGLKALAQSNELGFQMRIAGSFTLIAGTYLYRGDLNQSLTYCKKALSIKELGKRDNLYIFIFLGRIYATKGELDRSLKYSMQAIPLAEENYNKDQLAMIFQGIGGIYRMKNEYNKAVEYYTRSLTLSKQIGYSFITMANVFSLFMLNIENNFPDKAHQYLELSKKTAEQTENKIITQGYQIARAIDLKLSERRRNRAEAEKLLQQVVEDDVVFPELYYYSIVSLCDLLLEELSIYNNPEILEEINSLIKRSLDIAQKQNSYLILAEVKLLQAKVALVEMKIESAKKFLIEAQRIAEMRGLYLLAQKISSEHDTLLERQKDWENLKKEEAPMIERIKLASVDRVIDRISGKRAIDPPELVNEESILLLIMDNSGIPYFNHIFVENWDYTDLFSSFMSAFNTFSSEIFSKSIDRIRIGENTILINPIESFLACYVIKGQSYPALQKLTRFSEAIKENTEIWQALNKSVKTSEMLELNNLSILKNVINEIFT
jgi:tetratricopeptide (TPR) repeat protein